MRIYAERSLLLVIDIQQALTPAIHQISEVVNHTRWLIQIARELDVPVRATEQYPQGLGATVTPVASLLQTQEIWQKEHFSALYEKSIEDGLAQLGRQQIILVGTETHVCVLQTALSLLEKGYQVFLVEEALGSRRQTDKQAAMTRLRQAGAVIVTREMVAFEWLHKSRTEIFRKISKNYIR